MKTENVNKKNGKLPICDVRVMLPKVVAALEECLEWMETLRASGDAGFWEWKDDEYTKAQKVLNELRELTINKTKFL
jgi:hypothetical protein